MLPLRLPPPLTLSLAHPTPAPSSPLTRSPPHTHSHTATHTRTTHTRTTHTRTTHTRAHAHTLYLLLPRSCFSHCLTPSYHPTLLSHTTSSWLRRYHHCPIQPKSTSASAATSTSTSTSTPPSPTTTTTTNSFQSLNLHPEIIFVLEGLSFTSPTRVQSEVIPLALSGQNVTVTSPSGTGKTLSFLLPIIHDLVSNPSLLGRHRALIVSPTRELADQLLQFTLSLLNRIQSVRIRAASICGAAAYNPQIETLKNGVEIIVCCPGRLLDHSQINSSIFCMDSITHLVVDEADRQLTMGFSNAIPDVVRLLPENGEAAWIKRMFMSDTMPLAVREMSAAIIPNPVFVSHSKTESDSASAISDQTFWVVNENSKALLLL
eukprot:TRINITY_DN1050_c0_g1_i1.p1 TRINITY_DN1050_c0_g1~~TRINITY_DN1050_c0_g1_i1.p1  ORF type:complete len:376 (-),score=56.68 TRINITY_DN1050_c0_g1_i1:49-1176(-)